MKSINMVVNDVSCSHDDPDFVDDIFGYEQFDDNIKKSFFSRCNYNGK